MAIDQSAPLELLAQRKLTNLTNRIRFATETLHHEQNDAEVTALEAHSTVRKKSSISAQKPREPWRNRADKGRLIRSAVPTGAG